MKKLILRPRDWPEAFGVMLDSLFSGGVPFVPPPMLTFRPPARSPHDDAYEQMRGMQEDSYRQAMGAQASMMGGLGGSLLSQLMGYRPYETKPKSTLQEGKVDVQLKLTRIDKEHVLVEVECIRRIVHNAKELRELTAKLIEEHAEEFLFGELAKQNIRTTMDRAAKSPEPPGGMEKSPSEQVRS